MGAPQWLGLIMFGEECIVVTNSDVRPCDVIGVTICDVKPNNVILVTTCDVIVVTTYEIETVTS